jgi:hypothetical protein
MSGVVLVVLEMLYSSQRSKSAKGSSGDRLGWVSLSPFKLRDFCNRFPAHAPFRIVAVNRIALVGHGVPHKAVTQIAVMRNRECLAARRLFIVGQRCPERSGSLEDCAE